MTDTTTTPKARTITLTGRTPVTITDDHWPIIADASHDRYDGYVKSQANRIWEGWLKVRQHADGRTLIYGRDGHGTQWEGERGYIYRGGELLDAGADIPAAVMRVAQDLIARGADDAMIQVAHECIADLASGGAVMTNISRIERTPEDEAKFHADMARLRYPRAIATPVDMTLYDVTYSDANILDRAMPYSYLERLASQGYTVIVRAGHAVTPHTIVCDHVR